MRRKLKYKKNFARCAGYMCAHREFCVRWLAFLDDRANNVKYPEGEYPVREYCRVSPTLCDRDRSINVIHEKEYLK